MTLQKLVYFVSRFFSKVRGIPLRHFMHSTRVQMSSMYLPLTGLTGVFNLLTSTLYASVRPEILASSNSELLNSASEVAEAWRKPLVNSDFGALIDTPYAARFSIVLEIGKIE